MHLQLLHSKTWLWLEFEVSNAILVPGVYLRVGVARFVWWTQNICSIRFSPGFCYTRWTKQLRSKKTFMWYFQIPPWVTHSILPAPARFYRLGFLKNITKLKCVPSGLLINTVLNNIECCRGNTKQLSRDPFWKREKNISPEIDKGKTFVIGGRRDASPPRIMAAAACLPLLSPNE